MVLGKTSMCRRVLGDHLHFGFRGCTLKTDKTNQFALIFLFGNYGQEIRIWVKHIEEKIIEDNNKYDYQYK